LPTYSLNEKSFQIKRKSAARVTEKFKMIKRAAKNNVDAIILECMSIKPELQIIESKVLNPHYYVITNIREDHLEELGISE